MKPRPCSWTTRTARRSFRDSGGRLSSPAVPGGPRLAVYVEAGPTRRVACSIEWPGWSRVAGTEDDALRALAAYAPRYATVAARAGLTLPESFDLEVVERVTGTGDTDLGAPDRILDGDARALDAGERERLMSLMLASWEAFDETVAHTPAQLESGPPDARDRDVMVDHVFDAETAYARELGAQVTQPHVGDAAAIASLRAAITKACRSTDASGAWPVRYFIRRDIWHALDHMWEMEDRSAP